MVIPDINLLVYAYNEAAADHARAKSWWEDLLSGGSIVGVPWVVTLGFLRLMTHRAVLQRPMSISNALDRVAEWFAAPGVFPVEPGDRHLVILRDLLQRVGVGGNLTTDAHLAALALEHNAELHSNDADFARFPGVRLTNPIG